jgi:homospermidine synthase
MSSNPKFGKWWIGSLLDIDTSRKLIPHSNATVVQVVPNVLASIIYSLQNPDLGPIFPEDLPEYVMKDFVIPYLGEFVSRPVDWNPSLEGVPEKYHKTKDLLLQKFLVSPPVTQ